MIFEKDPVELKMAAILRATRKQIGASQIEFASKLSMTQSTYSRAENGLSLFTVFQWSDFCDTFGLHYHCYQQGLIDEKSFRTNAQPLQAKNKISLRYRSNEISVQELFPILQFFVEKLGMRPLKQLLRTYGVDPDCFIYRYNRVGLQLQVDLLKYLIQNDVLTIESLPELTKIVATPFAHGNLYNDYIENNHKNPIENIRKFLEKINRYQNYSTFSIDNVSENVIDFTRRFEESGKNLRNEAMIGNFMCEYLQQYVREIAKLNVDGPCNLTIKHLDCFFKGNNVCKYQIKIA